MTPCSFYRSLLQLQFPALNLRGRVASSDTIKLGLVRLTQTSTVTKTCRFSVDQMAKKRKDNKEKGIKRKRPKQEKPYFGGRFAQSRARRAEGAMDERNDDGPRRDQSRGNLASELWNQQRRQYHQQQPAYQAPSWPQASSFGAPAPPIPPPQHWPQASYSAPGPPLPHNFDPQSASFSPSWNNSGWVPLHSHPIPPHPPPPSGGFPHWGPSTGFLPQGHNYPATTTTMNNNMPHFHDPRGGSHYPNDRPFSSGSESRRNYLTRPQSSRGGGSGFPRDPNEIILTDTDQSQAPIHQKPKRPKKNKEQEKTNHPKPHSKDGSKLAPSAASGGVPDPTPEYLAQASSPPTSLPTPRPILVVIDLNGTLVFRRDPKRRPHICTLRPHAEAFLSYCFAHHKVAIWSSAQPKNVEIMVKSLLPKQEQRDQLIVNWGRDKFGLTEEDSRRRIQCYKRLTKLWMDESVMATGYWNQSNTVLIDDSIEKARSEPYNAITIPEFMGNLKEKPVVLKLVQEYLDILARQADISSYIKLHPFKADATAETRPTTADEERQANTATNPDEIDLESPGKEAHEESAHPVTSSSSVGHDW
ncbi:HAD-like domain containing protein [Rhypophila decipiens]